MWLVTISSWMIILILMLETWEISNSVSLSTLSTRVEVSSWLIQQGMNSPLPESYHLRSRNCISCRELVMASASPISNLNAAIPPKPTLSHNKDSFSREGLKMRRLLTLPGQARVCFGCNWKTGCLNFTTSFILPIEPISYQNAAFCSQSGPATFFPPPLWCVIFVAMQQF
jgi:hypothetical protein